MIYPQKVNNVSLDGHYKTCTCILALCYVCYHLLTGRCEGHCEDIFLPVYGILPYSIIVSTRLMFYKRRLGLCVFMRLCLAYAIST